MQRPNPLLFVAMLSSPVAVADTHGEGDAPISIPHETYTLDNGLTVVLAEDDSVPFVQVNVWYHVGSKDEEPGRKGFAHLFEHLMFQGSEHMDGEFFTPLQRIGARVNGTTNFDRTNYFEGVPSEYLPLALWLESDRMGWLLPALTQEKLDNQKEVVRNERRQNYEVRPYGEVWPWLHEALFPEGHPYNVPTIGLHEDIDAATLDDVKAFFEKWYVPNNATLTIAGDFEPAEARQLVERYFAEIPRGEDPVPTTAEQVALTEEVVVRKTDDVPHDKVWMAWLSPAFFAEDDADLDIVANVLSNGKDSRLYKELVREREIAKDVEAYQASSLLQSRFIIEATAAKGHTTDEVAAAIEEVLAQLREEGPTEGEVEVAKMNFERRFYESLQTISGKADKLNSYLFFKDDPAYIDEDLARYMAVTPASAKEAANSWLLSDKRVVLHVTPEGEQ